MKILINFYPGPGAGKSTYASKLFSYLKSKRIKCEYLTEFAKQLTYEGNKLALDTQMYVTGYQLYMTKVFMKTVDIVITDSPLLLGTQQLT